MLVTLTEGPRVARVFLLATYSSFSVCQPELGVRNLRTVSRIFAELFVQTVPLSRAVQLVVVSDREFFP